MQRNTLKSLLIAIIFGAFIGIISSYGDTLFNNGQFDIILLVTGYFNTATIWGISAFLIGERTKSRKFALILGVSLLLAAVITYYIYGATIGNRSAIPLVTILRTAELWSIVGIIVGSIYGIAGSIYKHPLQSKLRNVSIILLTVLILSENGAYLYQMKDYLNANNYSAIIMIVMFIFGISLPFILIKNFKKALITLAVSLLLSVTGAVILNLIFVLIRGY